MRIRIAVLAAGIFCASAFGQASKNRPVDKPGGAGGSADGNPGTSKIPTGGSTEAIRAAGPAGAARESAVRHPATSGPTAASDSGARAGRAIPAVRALHLYLHQIDFDGEPLEGVLEEIASATGANIVVHWAPLRASGVERDTRVTLNREHVTVAQVLREIMEKVESDESPLAYRADEDMILVSTKEEFEQELETRIYRVDDIISNDTRNPRIFTGRSVGVVASIDPVVGPGAVGFQPRIQTIRSGQIVQFPNNSVRSGGSRNRDARGGGVGSLNDIGRFGENFEPADEDDYDPAEAMRELIDVITATVDPDTWDVNGGRGTIRPFRKMLLVRNTPFVHQKLSAR